MLIPLLANQDLTPMLEYRGSGKIMAFLYKKTSSGRTALLQGEIDFNVMKIYKQSCQNVSLKEGRD